MGIKLLNSTNEVNTTKLIKVNLDNKQCLQL